MALMTLTWQASIIRPNHCNRESKDRGLLLAMKPSRKIPLCAIA